MEIIISPEALRNELRVFQNIVSRDTALTELSNLKIETALGRLFIYGTDMDVSLRVELSEESYETVEAGALCIKAHKLIDMLGTMDSRIKSIRLRREPNGWAGVLFGRSHFKIASIMPEQYPDVRFEPPQSETVPVAFPAGLLLQFLNSTEYAISSQDTRYALTGADLVVSPDTMARMVATDGFRVACIGANIPGEFKALFPKKAASVLGRLLAEIEPGTPVALTSDSNHVYAGIGTKRFSFRKLAGDFPNVDQILFTENDHMVTLKLSDLRSVIRRADIFADKNNQSSLTMTVRPGEMEIAARSFEEGSGNELIDATYNGPEIKLKLKSSHLTDFFSSIDLGETGGDPTLAMEFSDEEKKPTVWKVHHDAGVVAAYDYRCIITKLH